MKRDNNRTSIGRLLAGAAPLALSLAAFSSPAHAIVPNDNVTPAEAVDTDDEFSGVGMFFRNDGFVCTGTLINPRTVLFAAHCVNNRPETDYDQIIRSAFSFNVNALPGFQNWIGNAFASNPDLAVFNINRIYWNAQSTERPDSFGFLEGDIALASLDTPAAGLPTWSLLFSPLPTPDAITDADGTGYHVNITGYGRSGSGTTGASQGIDWRRRSAENMIGALTSFDERNTFLFGDAFGDLPQSLYRLDFDDPNKTNPFDFNLYKDEPRENEGTTAGGDSGGPLILDAANNTLSTEDLVIGVLSGGSRFFGPQVFSSYGTESFYQPLYLYWDYIVANNPYRYVSAKAGDGNWEDGSHWQTDLDPTYRVINASGNVVNGLPTSPGNGRFGDSPDFGEVCFDLEGNDPGDGCQDLATGDATPPARNVDGIIVESGIGIVDGTDLGGLLTGGPASVSDGNGNGLILDLQAQAGPDFAEENPHGVSGGSPEFSDDPLPAPTLANGLPGATGFVPDNIDPIISADPGINVDPRYFDVTLGAAGTTNLSSAVTIDRLTVRNSAGLYIAGTGDLTSLIDVNQFGGSVRIDGDLTSAGDYTLFAGFLGGNGTLTAPFVTNILGAISPGSTGTIGTFTIDGDAVLSSGSTLLIDLGAGGTSDNLNVTGEANVGGIVALGGLQALARTSDVTYEIVTAGSVTGAFTDSAISAILSQSFTYNPTSVEMTISIGDYVDNVNSFNGNQLAYAQLLDAERGNTALSAFYALDFADVETIRSTFDALAPTTETGAHSLTQQHLTNLYNFNEVRLTGASLETTGGTVATYGNPLGTAALASRSSANVDMARASGLQGEEPTSVTTGSVPYNMGVFLSGGFIQAQGDAMTRTSTDRDDYDGYFIGGGVEFYPSETALIGASVYYSDVDGDVALNNSVQSKALAGSVYGRFMAGDNVVIDGQASLTDLEIDTVRNVSLLGAPQTLVSNRSNTAFSAELGLGYQIPIKAGAVTPNVDLRYSTVEFDAVTETGGSAALRYSARKFESLQGRIGMDFNTKDGAPLQLKTSVHYVHDFKDNPGVFAAGFAGGTATSLAFPLSSQDQDWTELGASLSYNSGAVSVGVGIDLTAGRADADSQVYRATASVKF